MANTYRHTRLVSFGVPGYRLAIQRLTTRESTYQLVPVVNVSRSSFVGIFRLTYRDQRAKDRSEVKD